MLFLCLYLLCVVQGYLSIFPSPPLAAANAVPKYTHAHCIFHNLPTPFNTSFVTSSISACTFFLFSVGERRCEHNRVCISLQLWDGEWQENCYCCGNCYPFWLCPLLLVRHTHTHLLLLLLQILNVTHIQTKFPCILYLFVVLYHSVTTHEQQLSYGRKVMFYGML